MENYLLSCDWGTSSFRLSVNDLKTNKVIAQVKSEDGIGRVHRAWLTSNDQGNESRKHEFFKDTLKTHIQKLSRQTGLLLDHFPVVISGMASSSIGLADVPYASLPFPMDGSAAVLRHFKEEHDFLHEITLVSGVRSDNDVMRGEETQLIGIWSRLNESNTVAGEALFILPGTHSKHVYVKEGKIVGFKTFMTGEMFGIISRESILKDSIGSAPGEEIGGDDLAAFTNGVMYAKSANLLNSLFTVRTNQLFDRMSRAKNGLYLSGLLIGSELADVLHSGQTNIILCGGLHLHQLYRQGLHALDLGKQAIIVEPSIVEGAASAGHRIIYKNQA